jgi:hypothetical protein
VAIYRVEGVYESTGQDFITLVRADSEDEARDAIIAHGVRVQIVTTMRAADIPDDAEFVDASVLIEKRILKALRRVERSNLINHPIKTIACGILLALVLFCMLLLLIALLFGGAANFG